METSILYKKGVIKNHPELENTISLYFATTFIFEFIDNHFKNKDTTSIMDKNFIYEEYLNSIIHYEGLATLSKATFSFLFKAVCSYRGLNLVPLKSSNRSFICVKSLIQYLEPSEPKTLL